MLLELLVENYAVVDRLRVQFHGGLNLLTGETGSGKSIVVDALGLLLGGRASADAIRTGEQRARISGIFEVGDSRAVRDVLEPAGLEAEEGEIVIEREILASGKSRAFVGSRPAPASLLRELAPHLGDIHGQHDQQLLFSAEAQRDMLDAYAQNRELLERIAGVYAEWSKARAELEEMEGAEQEKLRLLDLWSFQRKEIEAAALKPGEDAALENERRVLLNLGRLQESAEAAYAALYDSPESALALLRHAARRVDELCRIDGELASVRENLQAAALPLEEASYSLRDYLGRLEANPGRQEEVEQRLAAIEKLKRKYGGSVEEVLAFLEEVRGQIAGVENAGERMERLRKERARLEAAYEKLAAELSERRRKAAQSLEKKVEKELAGLAMEGARLRVEFTAAPPSACGSDRVGYLFSANPGEEPRPLEKIASGGELSRIALALKTCLSTTHRRAELVRTLVFDEVDAGIGGSAADGVGRRLKQLAASSQVLCVTHLAQIACFADHHYCVEKHESNGRTVAILRELSSEARTREIGRMLSGQKLTPEALKHAEQLIRMSAV
jgi:DNA repair protein RecN (Recombination protein N)